MILQSGNRSEPMSIRDDKSFILAEKILDADTRDDEKLKKAESLLTRLAHRYSKDPVLHNAYARLYRRMGLPAQLYHSLLQAQGLTSVDSYPSPWLNLGIFYEGFEFWTRAAELYEAVLTAHASDEDARMRIQACMEGVKAMCAEYRLAYPPVAAGDKLLVRTLELLLAAGVRVNKAKCRLKDCHGLPHEMDLLAEIEILPDCHVPFVIECKDWTRKISRPVVDQLRSFLDHSRYRLGMIVVSPDFTQNARLEAAGSGILVNTISELERSIEELLKQRFKHGDRWEFRIRDRGEKGPDPAVMRRVRAAGDRLVGLGATGCVSDAPDLQIDERGRFIFGEQHSWFEPNEYMCYEAALGSLKKVPLLTLCIHTTWWNHMDDVVYAKYRC